MKNQHHPEDHKRLITFFVLAALVMALSYFFITKPQMDKMRQQQGVVTTEEKKEAPVTKIVEQGKLREVAEVLKAGERLKIDAPQLEGSLSTAGLRFDDIELKSYYTTLEQTERVRLLAPGNTKQSQFVEIGLMPEDGATAVPNQDTVWKTVSGKTLTPDTPLVLEWDNGAGLVFRRTVSIDENYLMTVKQEVTNNGSAEVTLYPYALVAQSHHIPAKGEKVSFEDMPSAIQHIGPLAYLNEDLHEEDYEDVKDDGKLTYENVKGWLGITSKYWLVALLPQRDEAFDARIAHQTGRFKQDIYQADLREKALVVAPNETADAQMRFFVGAKDLGLLNRYSKSLEVDQLDLAVDFGVLYFLTKPIYTVLSFLGNFFEKNVDSPVSFGLALLTLTVLLRLLTFPLQNKSYRTMNKMKDLTPKIHALKEKYGDDKQKFQQEVFAVYKKDKINPASGCLPVLLQIPIFFALYKVIYITLDMRHAPFWGWVNDLSAPDPTNVFNLFGLFSYETPLFLTIGAWPLLYGITMFLQQRLNPQPEDPVQKQVFAMMPWLFMFIFAKFPAGLVIYYTWSNILGIVQQYMLRRLHPGSVPPKKPRTKKKKAA